MSARDEQMARIEALLLTLATTHDLTNLHEQLASVKKDVEALNGLRRTGIGILIGVGMVASLIGGKVVDFLHLMIGKS